MRRETKKCIYTKETIIAKHLQINDENPAAHHYELAAALAAASAASSDCTCVASCSSRRCSSSWWCACACCEWASWCSFCAAACLRACSDLRNWRSRSLTSFRSSDSVSIAITEKPIRSKKLQCVSDANHNYVQLSSHVPGDRRGRPSRSTFKSN